MLNQCLVRFFSCLTRKKVIDANTIKQGKLQRKLKTIDLVIIGITATLGISIYIILGETVKNVAGPAVIISLLIDTVAALMSGVCYAELATRMPVTGSAYAYTSATLGEAFGFFVSWNLLFEYSIGTALFARGFTGYLDSLLKGRIGYAFSYMNFELRFWQFHAKLDAFAATLCILLTLVIVFGWEPTNFLLTVTLIGSSSVIVFMIVVGFANGDLSNWDRFMPFGLLGAIRGASTCFYSFVGYDVIAMSAEETINPIGSIPFAILLTIGISAILFVGMAMILTLLVPYDLISINATLISAFEYHGLYFLSYITFFGVVLGTIGGLTATLIPLPRLVYAMSEDGLLFQIFSRVSAKNGVPYIAGIFAGIFTALVALFFSINDLVRMMSMGTLMAYSSVCLCVIVLRYQVKSLYVPVPADFQSEDDDIDADDVDEEAKHSPEAEHKGSIEKQNGQEDVDRSENDPLASGASSHKAIDGKLSDESGTAPEGKEEDEYKSTDVEGTQQGTTSMQRFTKAREYLAKERLPTEKSEAVVKMCCICLVILMTALCCLAVYGYRMLMGREIPFIIGLVTIAISTFAALVLISSQPENKSSVYFRVPLVPWLPALSLFLNIYLIILLDRASWIRFGIWLFIGIILYFGYGIHRSNLGKPVELYTSIPTSNE